jgi:hypothetical protein
MQQHTQLPHAPQPQQFPALHILTTRDAIIERECAKLDAQLARSRRLRVKGA